MRSKGPRDSIRQRVLIFVCPALEDVKNHVNAKAAKTANKNLSKRRFARFATFAFNVILSEALQPDRATFSSSAISMSAASAMPSRA